MKPGCSLLKAAWGESGKMLIELNLLWSLGMESKKLLLKVRWMEEPELVLDVPAGSKSGGNGLSSPPLDHRLAKTAGAFEYSSNSTLHTKAID